MKFREIMKFGAVVFALLGSFALGHRSAITVRHSTGYWWRAAPASQKPNLRVWMGNGVTQGELVGCQEALLPTKPPLTVAS